jgi:hypothetical protein
VLLDPDQTVARRRPNEVTATDDEQQPGIGVLLLDASSSGATDGGASGGASLHPESGAGGDHRRLSGVDGGDDFGVVDPLQIDGRDPEVGVTQLPLYDVERHALVRQLDGVGVAQLVGGEAPPHTGLGGDPAQLGASGVAVPGPPAGRPFDHAQ